MTENILPKELKEQVEKEAHRIEMLTNGILDGFYPAGFKDGAEFLYSLISNKQPVEEKAGMKWVKASERLPEKYLGDPRHVKIDGMIGIGNFYEDYIEGVRKIFFSVNNPPMKNWSIPPEKFNGLEWLEE